MKDTAQALREVIDASHSRLLSIPEGKASAKPYADKWSYKEVLGHLLDSAANNHHRIVRMQEQNDIGKFVYTQQHWVQSQHYADEPWSDIVDFWWRYNRHIAHIIARIDPASLGHTCDMGYAKPATLKFVAEDYVRHVQHHIEQILSEVDPKGRVQWVRRTPE